MVALIGLFGSDALSNDDVQPLRVVTGNPVASYCDDWNHVDVSSINDIPIITFFCKCAVQERFGVTLTLILAMLWHSPLALVLIPLLNVMHLAGIRG